MSRRSIRRERLAAVQRKRDVWLEDGEPEADDVPSDERIPIGPLDVSGEGLPISPEDWPLPTHGGLIDFDHKGL